MNGLWTALIVGVVALTGLSCDTEQKEASLYVKYEGIGKEEALNRLRLITEAEKMLDEITQNEPSYAGYWVRRQPEFQMVFAFSENGQSIIEKYLADYEIPRGMVETVTFEYSLAELKEALDIVDDMRFRYNLMGVASLNMLNNTVDLKFLDDASLITDKLEDKNIELPECVQLLPFDQIEISDTIITAKDREADESNRTALLRSSWEAVMVNGETVSWFDDITLSFKKTDSFGGKATCNSYGGNYYVKGFYLRTANLFQTDMACGKSTNELEDSYFHTLSTVCTFDYYDDYLLMYDETGRLRLVFEETS